MTRTARIAHVKWLVSAISVIVLSGCASVNFDNSVAKTNQDAAAFTQGKLALAQTQAQRTALDRTAAQLLAEPLSQGNAVQLALVNSPALQAMLAQNWSDAANAAQLLAQPDIDGGLVGGASLKAPDFLSIIASAL